jgi:hypothetical protein
VGPRLGDGGSVPVKPLDGKTPRAVKGRKEVEVVTAELNHDAALASIGLDKVSDLQGGGAAGKHQDEK